MEILTNKPQSTASQSQWVREVTPKNFMKDVIEASMKALVLLDFWADWCGPCKQLTPVLEKLTEAAGGKIILAKVNIDKNPEIPAQFGVQSVPTVIVFKNGQAVDGFSGAVPETELKKYLEALMGAPLGAASGDGLAAPTAEEAWVLYDSQNFDGALQLFSSLYNNDPQNPDLIAGLALSELALGSREMAENLLADIPEQHLSNPKVARAKALLELAKDFTPAANIEDLLIRALNDKKDFEARYEAAPTLFMHGRMNDAMNLLLEIIAGNRSWNDDAARKLLLKFFDALGAENPLTISTRRKLSSILFS